MRAWSLGPVPAPRRRLRGARAQAPLSQAGEDAPAIATKSIPIDHAERPLPPEVQTTPSPHSLPVAAPPIRLTTSASRRLCSDTEGVLQPQRKPLATCGEKTPKSQRRKSAKQSILHNTTLNTIYYCSPAVCSVGKGVSGFRQRLQERLKRGVSTRNIHDNISGTLSEETSRIRRGWNRVE